jgi:hypothetical protein
MNSLPSQILERCAHLVALMSAPLYFIDGLKLNWLEIYKGFIAILISTILSFWLANSSSHHSQELGAMVNLIAPPLAGIVAFGIYLITYWITKNNRVRVSVAIISCVYLIYLGIALHFEKDYWPLVI